MQEKLKIIPYWLYDLLSVVASVVTIVSGVFAIINAKPVVEKLDTENYYVSYNKCLLLLVIVFAFCSIVFFLKFKKYGTIMRNMKKTLAYDYYLFLHDFRNSYFEILNLYKSRDNKNDYAGRTALTNETKNFLVNALDYLCKILEICTGQEICACIKLIENHGKSTNINLEEAKVSTFCRSKNSDSRRVTDKNSKLIKDNTDFFEILSNENGNSDSFFYQTDLKQYEKALEKVNKVYRNTTKNYEKYYRGTIVAPIRVRKDHLHFLEEETGYDVIGFLCVDSLSTEAFRDIESDKINYSRILKSFAAEMYIILNKYTYYLNKMSGGNNEKNI